MTTQHRPACIDTALAIRREEGEAGVEAYFDTVLTNPEKKCIDIWLLNTQHPLILKPGPRRWRFLQLIQTLFEGD